MNIDIEKLTEYMDKIPSSNTRISLETIKTFEVKPVDCGDCNNPKEFNNPMENCSYCINNPHFENNFKPKTKQKIIDLSMMVGSDIDMEFSRDVRVIGKLTGIKDNYYYRDDKGNDKVCRIRQDHWHHWNGDECPLPEGLIVTFRYINDDGCIEEARISQYRKMNWATVTAFKVLGTDDARYEWQKENENEALS